MKELDELLAAHKVARRSKERCLLATLVKVEGSSYRRVGARMLMTAGGGRTSAISGGCLEAEIQKKAWWLTEQGPVIQQYRTSTEEGLGMPYGLGCSGTLHVLLKRVSEEDSDWLESLGRLRTDRTYAALATALTGPAIGTQWLFPAEENNQRAMQAGATVQNALRRVAAQATSEYLQLDGVEFFLEALPPRQRLIVFGAGDDAKPLVKFARLLGWDVTIADGRTHLATEARFPEATSVVAAPPAELAQRCAIRGDDAVVVMTHSFEQDQELLGAMLAKPLRYLGQLGPRQRTKELLVAIVGESGSPLALDRLHSPIGLDIGAHTPETIALAIIAEVQSVLSKLDLAGVAKTKASATGVPA